MKKSKKVVICGFAGVALKGRDENFEAALRSCGFEIWTMNDWWNFLPWLKSPDRVFQVHVRTDGTWEFPEVWAGGMRIGTDWRGRYNRSGATIVTIADNPGVERQMRYPQEYLDKYGPSYFASSANYMMAMAVEEEYGTVSVQDCAMYAEGEYTDQLPALIYAIRDARGRGVDVICPFEAVWQDAYAKAGMDIAKAVPPPRQFPYGFNIPIFRSQDAQLRNDNAA